MKAEIYIQTFANTIIFKHSKLWCLPYRLVFTLNFHLLILFNKLVSI